MPGKTLTDLNNNMEPNMNPCETPLFAIFTSDFDTTYFSSEDMLDFSEKEVPIGHLKGYRKLYVNF